MLSKAKVTGQHPSASSTCLFICGFIFMSYWTMCRWMHLALLEKQNLGPPAGSWQRRMVVPKWQRTGRAATKSPRRRGQWKLELILGLVKMTLPFTLGFKWIVDASINAFLQGAFEGPFSSRRADYTTIRGQIMVSLRLAFTPVAVHVCSVLRAGWEIWGLYSWIGSC